MRFFVYILASRRNGTLYSGVTNNLSRRIGDHRPGRGSSFNRRYGVKWLVHAEPFDSVTDAIAREKQIKGWNRAWKIRAIATGNPAWEDLSDQFYG